jgi:hypothetical protein
MPDTHALAQARMKIVESVAEGLKGKGPSSLADEADPRTCMALEYPS